ncbi:hypothetical protein [Krasilnikovia sp. MM14-A1259]|uniref:hypothetical protein n=1 Tax=Krasilnikovia sp. MM14-A1259 TaxID=3373539 RepID=UPI003808F84D
MTTFAVPPAGAPAWREIYLTPPDVGLDMPAGTRCPIDGTALRPRLDGWACPMCGAAWDFRGLGGRWLPDTAVVAAIEPTLRRRVSPVAVAFVLAVVAGCALAAAGLVSVMNEFDKRLLWWLAALVGAAAVAVVLGAFAGRFRDWLRYRHNRVVRVLGERVADGDVVR